MSRVGVLGMGCVALMAAVLGLMALSAAATPAPVEASARVAPASEALPQNDAVWTVTENTFLSAYPNGFKFVLQAQSSGGSIVSARVEWQHRAHNRPRQPISVRRETGEIDAETGVITAVWRPSGSTGVPPWVAVYYTWELRDAAGNVFETDVTETEYADNTRAWLRTESEDAIVFSEGLPAGAGELVLQALRETRQKYLDGWGQTLPYKPRIILFHDLETFSEWQVDRYDTTNLGYVSVGLTSDAWGGTAQVLFGSTQALAYETVLHEVEHMHQYEYLFPGRTAYTPGWFYEGDARFYEMGDHFYDRQRVLDLAASGELPTLLQGTGPGVSGMDPLLGYAMGYMFWDWLVERWGMTFHRELMALLNQNAPLNDALATLTGMDALQVEREWRAWLGATPLDPPTLIPTPTPLPLLLPPTPMTFGSGGN